MASTSTNMQLTLWNDPNDKYNSAQLVSNLTKVDGHDHTAGKGVQIPTGGISNLAVTGEKLANNAVSTDKIADSAVTASKVANQSLTHGHVAATNVDGAVATPSLRTLGFGATQAAPGADVRRYQSGTIAARPAPALANRGNRYLATDYGVEYVDTGGTWVAVGFEPTVVDVLPASPYSGQLVYFRPDPTSRYPIWPVRYDPSISGLNKWVAVGGVPLTRGPVGSSGVITSGHTTWRLYNSGPEYTTTAAGSYRLNFGAHANPGESNTVEVAVLPSSTTSPSSTNQVVSFASSAATDQGNIAGSVTLVVGSGEIIRMACRSLAAVTWESLRPWFNLTPVLLG